MMLVNKRIHGYSMKKKLVIGRGFIDSMSSIFNSVGNSFKSSVMPALGSAASYHKTNKDLMLKPMIGAVGQLGAKALTEGVPALINRIQERNRNKANNNNNKLLQTIQNTQYSDIDQSILEDPKFKELLQVVNTPIPVSNME